MPGGHGSNRITIAVALIAFAGTVAAAIIGNALGYYDRWAKPATTPITSVVELEQRLSQAGLILSEVDVPSNRRYLRDDPSMQALARNILTMLGTRRVSRPIPFDVVAGRYKELLGYRPEASLKPEQYGDTQKLEQALVLAFNERSPSFKASAINEIFEKTAQLR